MSDSSAHLASRRGTTFTSGLSSSRSGFAPGLGFPRTLTRNPLLSPATRPPTPTSASDTTAASGPPLPVMKVETCSFSGYKIYPSKGKLYVQKDSKVYRFIRSKEESLHLHRKNPRKLSWTVVFRRVRRKGVTEEVAKKRSKKSVKAQRGIVGADLATILARRNQKPEVRTAQREEAVRKAKEEKKKKAEAAKKSAVKPSMGKSTAPKVSKQQAKGAKPSNR
ncbi:hypothetical protein PCANC_08205 [Puccinia coronata f. sp. avenae]|uniref:Large ribosomal subunit protein eL24-related N-terminal domain-containing protein n=1 Tax=Puccinia coronata f. sp. avenae TaxID=200324 RepID=A0A2N5VJA9_9BASI|nr:hypothetical protein PCASD_19847 [Puccinia coronata f. sp. avenae]PLW50073.1 hypothetical protein PCANC_08205 [Puccinia coronata f. sp. avenae]